ncbi:hypothetical protein KFL_003980040 [Klebsormidium nitens]|uniref:NAD(P)-binding domain-containing protein n=1 Tax=Klebsormidium nitens TaxID=105231 RepID=A0A1Y1IF38_KLENI|nr:hypothetical protein KFL_003980040 [Klebsormidium nitens]|eukprot:GAQ88069.1 hypothetical protein KFL_003980040 [Klebsormidium nitens]
MAATANVRAPALIVNSLGEESLNRRQCCGAAAIATSPLLCAPKKPANLVRKKTFLEGAAFSSTFQAAKLSLPQRTYARNERGKVLAQAAADGPSKAKEIDEPVLVVGATGGVGQIVVSYLLDRGHQVRAVLRNKEKAEQIFGHEHDDQLEMFVADTRHPDTLRPEIFEGVGSVICCTGTTAFPSKRWDGGKPEETDYHGFKNLLEKTPKSIKKFVLVSSVGVESYNSFPYNILNLFGVLKWKKLGEEMLEKSGHPFTIIRAGRLMDGPYTSYDLNTLLKTASGTRRAVILSKGDKLRGEASRLSVAEACLQALQLESTNGHIYEINSAEGDGPGTDSERWAALFSGAERVGQAKS